MKSLVALLVVINVAIFLLIGGDRDASNIRQELINNDVNKQGMLLIQELKNIDKQQSNSQLNVTSTDVESRLNNSGEPAVMANGCVRIGPFERDSSFWIQSVKWLDEANLDYKIINSVARDLKSTRVLLGTFTDERQAQAQTNMLKEKGVNYFTRKTSNGEVVIHLGYFLKKELADAFLAHLQSIGINAYIDSELRKLEPHSWIDVSIKHDIVIKTLQQQLPDRVKITAIDCQS